jgi:hypothetical protein
MARRAVNVRAVQASSGEWSDAGACEGLLGGGEGKISIAATIWRWSAEVFNIGDLDLFVTATFDCLFSNRRGCFQRARLKRRAPDCSCSTWNNSPAAFK